MASFLLGDEYESSSSSSDDEVPREVAPKNTLVLPSASTAAKHLLPSADELFSTDSTSSVLTDASTRSSVAQVLYKKRKNEQLDRPATKAVKKELGNAVHKPQIAPFAPPQLRRPNISTEDRGAWNTLQTLARQKRVQDARLSP